MKIQWNVYKDVKKNMLLNVLGTGRESSVHRNIWCVGIRINVWILSINVKI